MALSEQTETAFIALGSNLGDSPRLIRDAFIALQLLTDSPLISSSLWRGEPVDCPPGSPPFINAVAALQPRPDETPHSLLAKLQNLERQFGRQPKIALNEPRPLDLDLLAFGSREINSPELILPHPRAHLRRFVLQPWSEIAPNFILPAPISASVATLLSRLAPGQVVARLSSPDSP